MIKLLMSTILLKTNEGISIDKALNRHPSYGLNDLLKFLFSSAFGMVSSPLRMGWRDQRVMYEATRDSVKKVPDITCAIRHCTKQISQTSLFTV